jgi:threonine aldolase
MDGARLWESQPFYGRSYVDISANFDSVYISFYKTLGALSGAALAGPADVIDEAKLWQHRHGGRQIRAFPAVVSARLALDRRLDRMAAYHDKTVNLAAALRGHPDIEVTPDPPHTNMVHIYLRGERDRLIDAALATAADTGIFITRGLRDSPRPAWQTLELTTGDATLDLPDDTIRNLFDQWLARANQP